MLFFIDLPAGLARLDAGELGCPFRGCDGQLGSWGTARARTVRHSPQHHDQLRARRARCRRCGRTHVLSCGVTYPRRADTAATVGSALLAASGGLGHRQVAKLVDRPHTTVRDWIRRARANANRVWSHATRWAGHLDPGPDPFRVRATGLAAALEATGLAVAAWSRRLGPLTDPWAATVVLTAGVLLAPPRAGPTAHPLDSL